MLLFVGRVATFLLSTSTGTATATRSGTPLEAGVEPRPYDVGKVKEFLAKPELSTFDLRSTPDPQDLRPSTFDLRRSVMNNHLSTLNP
jgi:hypothetical protein